MIKKSNSYFLTSLSILCLVFIVYSLTTYASSKVPSQSSSYSQSSALHVEGRSIKDAKGNSIRLIGVNATAIELAHNTWHTSNFDDWYNKESLLTIKKWGCNSFRLPMTTDVYINNPDILLDYEKYIDLIISCGMYVIVEWGYCGNPLDVESYANSFFSTLSEKYANNPLVLYEICNEPFNSTWSQIRAYSERIIPVIRNNAPDSIIIVGTPYKSSTQSDTPYTTIESPLNYINIVYTLHNYVGQTLTYDSLNYIKEYYNSNLALLITEFGTTMSTGTDGHFTVPSIIYLKYLDKYNTGWYYFNMSDIHFSKPTYDSSICKPGMWNNSLTDSSLSDSGLFFKRYLNSNGTKYNLSNCCMMTNHRDDYAFWSSTYKDIIKHITITTNRNRPSSYNASWDISIDQSGNVMAYLVNDTLYIIPTSGKVYAPEDSDRLFSSLSSLESIDFGNMDFSYVVSMRSSFRDCNLLKQVDFLNKPFPQLRDITCIFSNCQNLTTIKFAGCDMSNLNSIIRMCESCSSLNQISLGIINASAITSIDKAFIGCPQDKMTIYVKSTEDKSLFAKLSPKSSVTIY